MQSNSSLLVLRGNTGALRTLLTWLDAREGQSVLSNEVIPWCFVIVLHHKANQRQLRGVDGEI